MEAVRKTNTGMRYMKGEDNIRYRKENDGCFLVMDIEDDMQKDELCLKMLTGNSIEGLLRPEIRSINDKRSLCYDVTDFASLSVYCKSRELSEGELKKLLSSLLSLIRRLPDYFLDPEGLSLCADRIYTDSSSYFFCYRPAGYPSDENDSAGDLAKELIGLIDDNDSGAVFLGYRFYKEVRESGMGLGACICKTLDGENTKGCGDAQTGDEKDTLKEMIPESPKRQTKTDSEVKADESIPDEEGKNSQDKKHPDVVLVMIFATLFLLGVFLCYRRYTHITPFSMALFMSAGEGVTGVMFTVIGAAGAGLTFFKS